MITALIVDDELWVCQLIKRIVKWEELNFSIIGEAHDGKEALELIKAKKPDLVISDIRMPSLDGISLIKTVKELEFATNFIFISGYNDFEYAKGALKYGALGYLLKPIDGKELTDLLLQVRKSVFSKREKVIEEKLVKGKLAYSLNQLKEQFFLNFLLSNLDRLENFDIDKLNQEYETKFKDGCYQVIIYKVDSNSYVQVNENTKNEVLGNIQQVLISEFEYTCFDIVTVRLKSQVFCIMNYHQMKDFVVRNSLKTSFIKIKNSVPFMNYFDLTVGIGSYETDFNLLPKSYTCAQDSVKARVTMGVNQIIDISKNIYNSVELKELFPIEKEMKLIHFLEIFDNQSAQAIIAELFDTFTGRSDINPCMVFEISYQIVEIFYKVMRRMEIVIENNFIKKNVVYSYLEECKSILQILDCFNKLFDEAWDFYNNLKQKQNRKVIEIVKSYICDHFKEEISLNDVASLVFMNPKYIGELFKKETGINFSDYVINYRIDIAKELLTDVRYRTNEVSELVGYKDAKYFSKLFKRVVGVNPAKYKKMFA